MLRFSPGPNRAQLVNWREWGEDAFREARAQDKLLVVCITAFWCGFCQRLDESTFSDDDVITLLNAYFVPVRVEESQRPDVDLRYNQGGGWPTIVFLTPAGDLLFSANYLDPEAFVSLLVQLVDSYQRDRSALLESTARPPEESRQLAKPEQPAPLSPAIVAEVAGMLEGLADPVHGGFGSGDKLFHTEANEFLLYLFETTGERIYLDPVLLTLDTIRRSRTFDAKDGGFFRYSSRRDWQEPHPEKLLDDQAALLGNYLHAFMITEEPRYWQTAEELVDFLDATLVDPSLGVFSGCQDYVRLKTGRAQTSGEQLTPLIDRLVYCDANARATSAHLSAWWLLGREDCRARAEHVLGWMWRNLRAPDGGMCHYWDGAAQAPGMLMDTVMTGRVLLDAYAVLDDVSYLERARQLAGYLIGRHRGPEGGFFDISETGPGALSVRMTVLTQNAAAAIFFVRLADLSGETRYRDWARWALRPFPNSHRSYDAFAAGFGHALALLLSEPAVITVSGRPGDASLRRQFREALGQVRPRSPVARFRAAEEGSVIHGERS